VSGVLTERGKYKTTCHCFVGPNHTVYPKNVGRFTVFYYIDCEFGVKCLFSSGRCNAMLFITCWRWPTCNAIIVKLHCRNFVLTMTYNCVFFWICVLESYADNFLMYWSTAVNIQLINVLCSYLTQLWEIYSQWNKDFRIMQIALFRGLWRDNNRGVWKGGML